ncbi:uncharacterized protein [Dermacentor albipictus]|uniref:uncharacterized protein n=1 Tax=Dermacentor albipictus TaxID=60249 RepID=UPI0038FC4DA6
MITAARFRANFRDRSSSAFSTCILRNKMQCTAVALATICIVVVRGDRICTKSGNCGPSTCGPLEVPVRGKPQRDHFCRPLFTPAWELQKLRTCVCKPRYLRNSWGECIPRKKCIPCKFRWQRDYRTCAPGCPATCNVPFSESCNKPCSEGCDCPPGYVVHPKLPKMCIKADKCLPKCPANSSFQACVSSCRPKCGENPPKNCDTNCHTGACICNKGYAELQQGGKKTCVLQGMCSRYSRTKPLLQPNATRYTAGRAPSPVTTNLASNTSRRPESVGLPVQPGHAPTNAATTLGGTLPSGSGAMSSTAITIGTRGTLSPVATGMDGNVVHTGSEDTRSTVATVEPSTATGTASVGTVSSGTTDLSTAVRENALPTVSLASAGSAVVPVAKGVTLQNPGRPLSITNKTSTLVAGTLSLGTASLVGAATGSLATGTHSGVGAGSGAAAVGLPTEVPPPPSTEGTHRGGPETTTEGTSSSYPPGLGNTLVASHPMATVTGGAAGGAQPSVHAGGSISVSGAGNAASNLSSVATGLEEAALMENTHPSISSVQRGSVVEAGIVGTHANFTTELPVTGTTTSPVVGPVPIYTENGRNTLVMNAQGEPLGTAAWYGLAGVRPYRQGRHGRVNPPVHGTGFWFPPNPRRILSPARAVYPPLQPRDFKYYPWRAPFISHLEHESTSFRFYPWRTPSLFPMGLQTIGLKLYPWGTPFGGNVGHDLAGFEVYPWGSSLGFSTGPHETSFGFGPWGTLSRFIAPNVAAVSHF